jgi:hypothetical protein
MRKGRQKGQVFETETTPTITLDENFRFKDDTRQYVLQKISGTEEKEDEEDAGWITLGYFTSHESIFNYLVKYLTRQKARKDVVLPFEKYLTYFKQSKKEVEKMFEGIDMVK